jgi:hypothetical protein
VLVNGEVVGHGAYPRRDELARLAGPAPAASRRSREIALSVRRRLRARLRVLLMAACRSSRRA